MSVNSDRIRILIVDDHTLLLDALCDLLGMEADIEIAGKARDGAAAVAMAGQVQPDLVLLDVEMPGSPPTVTIRRLLETSPEAKIVVLSMYDNPELVQEVLDAGASGYLHKSVGRQELVAAIRGVRSDPRRGGCVDLP
jgi:two-component system, NarL family, nitrate/nitrite response regulator NarL